MNATQTAQKVRTGQLKAEELTKNCIEVIKRENPALNAFLEIFEDSALAQARGIDAKAPEKRGKLAGVCVAIKDNILYKGHIASCASKMLEHYKAPYNATVVEELLKEDAIIIGRTNMDEFAMLPSPLQSTGSTIPTLRRFSKPAKPSEKHSTKVT